MQGHLLKHCDRFNLIYSNDRLIPIDTKDPSSTDPNQYRTEAYCNERLHYWQLRKGISTAESSETLSVPIAKVYADDTIDASAKVSEEAIETRREISNPPPVQRKRSARVASQKKEPEIQINTPSNVESSRKRAQPKPSTPAKKSKRANNTLNQLVERYYDRNSSFDKTIITARTPSTRTTNVRDLPKESANQQSTTTYSNVSANTAVTAPSVVPFDIEKVMDKFADRFTNGIARSLIQINQNCLPEKKEKDNEDLEEENSNRQLLLEEKRALKAQYRSRVDQQIADEREERRRALEIERRERQDAIRHSQLEEARRNAHQRYRECTSDFMLLLQLTRQPAWTTLDVNRLPGDKPTNNVIGDASGRLSSNEEALLQRLLLRRMESEDQNEEGDEDY
jgi:hypothetical protein